MCFSVCVYVVCMYVCSENMTEVQRVKVKVRESGREKGSRSERYTREKSRVEKVELKKKCEEVDGW